MERTCVQVTWWSDGDAQLGVTVTDLDGEPMFVWTGTAWASDEIELVRLARELASGARPTLFGR